MNLPQLGIELTSLKKSVIGLVIDGTRIEMLLKYDNKATRPYPYIKTIYITCYLAIQSYNGTQLPNTTIHLFPDNKSLYDMLQNPFEWDKWLKSLKL